MLHLKTFGGLSVLVDDTPGRGTAQQRKPLALLALLAAAGRRGISRDKLIAYLWPEADMQHGRGLLKQACYALRRDLDAPALFLGTSELRLNPSVIASDVQGFETALERREDADAAKLYAGCFLDGFYLSGADEFERWVEAERGRLQQRAGEALERLATGAAARGEYISAVAWWRRLAGLDPLNSRVALGLMSALVAAGDRAGALHVARAHEARLRDELDAAPDPAVVELTERLRAQSEPPPGNRAVPVRVASEDIARIA
jgi:DNA-binding SARP family transcriptional activator